jgi:serpin B
MDEIVGAGLSFGFRLFAELYKREPGRNIFVSPLSVLFALSIAYNGSRGETKHAMAKALCVHTIGLDKLNQANSSLLAALEELDPKVHLIIANALWTSHDIRFKEDFLTDVKFYRAEIVNLDFHSPDVASLINEWIRKKTRGKIPLIVDELPLNVVLLILNAVYFKGTWKHAFEKSDTREEAFILPDGTKKRHPIMFQNGLYKYYRDKDFQAVSLPYGYGRISMYVFLPDKDLEEFHRFLNPENWNRWMHQFRKMEGTIGIPRFKMEYGADLENVLTAMGMGIAFDKMRADFGDMVEDAKVWINKVIHKTYLKVDEKGSEAAAVTEVILEKEEPPEETFTMIVNRPFFFAIRDNDTGAVLFMGSVIDPEE